MCGIAGLVGHGWTEDQLSAMIGAQHHRGPDDTGRFVSSSGLAGLGHNRLSIIDLSPAGHQPMASADGRCWIAFNGEVYNYLELRETLDYPFRSRTDTEVILAAYEKWGEACLDRLVGMFAFLVWDDATQTLFGARDRFGVKPLYYSDRGEGGFAFASEIKALHAAGVPALEDPAAWAVYLGRGQLDHSAQTFWAGIRSLLPGHACRWKAGELSVWRWYDLAGASGIDYDDRPAEVVSAEYLERLRESVRLRFRADVPVGINLSGGLDSSLLLSLVRDVHGSDSRVRAYTFVTGDPAYDETPWVRRMVERTAHPLHLCELTASDVPGLAEQIQHFEDEPFGGLPTLAYARLFEQARADGAVVLLDGQGLDEQWAGYDYYRATSAEDRPVHLQGSTDSPIRPECLSDDFRALVPVDDAVAPFPDRLRNLQYRDACRTKIPRALRFNDRASMRSSTELREPFLDHRLFELALRQPAERKLNAQTGKLLLRTLVASRLPGQIVDAPKRPLQTPQREWLRGPLATWAAGLIEEMLASRLGAWFRPAAVRTAWTRFLDGGSDNSFYVWQWISVALILRLTDRRTQRQGIAFTQREASPFAPLQSRPPSL